MPIGVVMLVKYKHKFDEEKLKEIRARFMRDLGLTDEDFYFVATGGALQNATNKDYDIIPVDEKEFAWLNVNFYRAWYSIGYQRGDINLYIKSAEWLELNIPNCEVYYGHDGGNDENIKLFSKSDRETLLAHHKNLNN